MDFSEFLFAKSVDLVIAFLLGILILVLHRRADQFVHKQVQDLHDYVMGEQQNLLGEIHQMIEKEQMLDRDVHKIIEEQQELLGEIHQIHEDLARQQRKE
jgi:hypothetical protein